MRHIDFKKIQNLLAKYPNLKDWEDIEKSHVEVLRGMTQKERSAYFKSHADWNKWIPILSELSNGKCWYTESPRNSNRWTIEHFRPKNRAKIAEDQSLPEGYWWLAYNVENFRLAGSIVNLRRQDEFTEDEVLMGKGNYFPIDIDKCSPCKPEQNHKEEFCMLLDPINFKDTTLISFDADGSVICTKKEGTIEYKKVKTSVEFLALDHTHIKDERKKIWDACLHQIKEAARLHGYQSTPQNEESLDKVYDAIKDMTVESTPFSSTAKACIKFHCKVYSDRYPWLEDILESI